MTDALAAAALRLRMLELGDVLEVWNPAALAVVEGRKLRMVVVSSHPVQDLIRVQVRPGGFARFISAEQVAAGQIDFMPTGETLPMYLCRVL